MENGETAGDWSKLGIGKSVKVIGDGDANGGRRRAGLWLGEGLAGLGEREWRGGREGEGRMRGGVKFICALFRGGGKGRRNEVRRDGRCACCAVQRADAELVTGGRDVCGGDGGDGGDDVSSV